MTKVAVPNPGALVLPLANPGKQLGDGGDFAELLGRPPGKASITPVMAFPGGESIRPDPIAPPAVPYGAPWIVSALASPDGRVAGSVTASPLPTLEFPITDASALPPASASKSPRAVELSAPGSHPMQWTSGGTPDQLGVEESAARLVEGPQLLVPANRAETVAPIISDVQTQQAFKAAPSLPLVEPVSTGLRATPVQLVASLKASTPQPLDARVVETDLPEPEAPVCAGSSGSVTAEMPVTVPAAVYPNEPVWSRVYPEHLFTNGYLSVIDIQARDDGSCEEPFLRSRATAPIDLKDTDAAFAPDTVPEVSADAMITVESLDTPLRAVGSRTPSDVEDFIESLSRSLGPEMAADHAWSERLLRLSRDSQGMSTVWLRDYTLREADIPPVIEVMKRHAYQEGFAIDRVVINGREVWRASTTLQGRD